MKFIITIKTFLKITTTIIVMLNLATCNTNDSISIDTVDIESETVSVVERVQIETMDIQSETIEPLMEEETIEVSIVETETAVETKEVVIVPETEEGTEEVVTVPETEEEITTMKVVAETVENVKEAFESVSYYDPEDMYCVEPGCGYTSEDLEYLSKIMWNEAGSYWITDEQQMLFGQVVLNRVNAPVQFPNTIKEVALAPNQYDCDFENITPDKRAIDNARKLLSGEVKVDMPHTVVFQANFPQGSSTWLEVEFEELGTTYFCHAYYIEYYQ